VTGVQTCALPIWASRQQSHRLRRSAVVSERAEQRVYISEVVRGRAGESSPRGVSDQVEVLRVERAIQIRTGATCIVADDCVLDVRCAATVEDAAAGAGAVGTRGAVRQRQRAAVQDAAAGVGGEIGR